MSIPITQPFKFDSDRPNFDRDVINSATDFESANPNVLTNDERAALGTKYDIGHIVWDTSTKRHYAVDEKTVVGVNMVYLRLLGPTTRTTQEWNNLSTYIPYEGEVIIFSDYQTETMPDGTTMNIPVIKIGDGVHNAQTLPFMGQYSEYSATSGVASRVAEKLYIGDQAYDGSEEVRIRRYEGEIIHIN